MNRCALVLLAILAVDPARAVAAALNQSASQTRIAPNAEAFTLENGMQVVVIPDHRAPVVTQMVWYRAGAADEENGQSGVAHLLEHLMFKGTSAHPGNELDRRVAAIGGEQNAFTAADYTAYFERVATEHLGEMMELEADRMVNLVLSEQVVAPERDVVLNERLEVVESEPRELLNEALLRLLYLNHPYGRPIIGWNHEIKALSAEAALAFYRRHYTPDSAILIVAGDVTSGEVRGLAEQTYGKLPARPHKVRYPRPAEPAPPGRRTIVVRHENVAEPQVQAAYLVASALTAGPGEAEALSVLAELVGGGATSRFYDELIRGAGPATEAGAFYNPNGLDSARFVVYGVPKPGISLRDLEGRIQQILTAVQEKGVSVEEVERAKRSLIADAIYAVDDQEALANSIGEALATGQTLRDVQDWPARIQAVTAASVQAVAHKYLRPAASATGYLEPPEP
jgi:zinc protease